MNEEQILRSVNDPKRQKGRLHHLKLNEVSLVDRPANPLARITLIKRRDDGRMQLTKAGHDQPQKPRSFTNFEDAVAAIAEAEGVPKTTAMTQARKSYPALFAKMQSGTDEVIAKATPEPVTASKATASFDALVSQIAARDGIGKAAAMSKARRENPVAYRLLQEA